MVKKRGPLRVVLFALVTLGLYLFYWYLQTSKELVRETGSGDSPVLYTILLFVPLAHLISFWKHAHWTETATDKHSGAVLFLMWVIPFLWPFALYLSQDDINSIS